MPPGLREAATLARAKADVSTDWRDHRIACALEAAVRAESDRVMLDALSEPSTPETAPPPWSTVSEPGTSEGPIPF